MRSLFVIALAQLFAVATAKAETTSFTADTVVISFDSTDLMPMQNKRGQTSSGYSNYVDYPFTSWAKGRNGAYIQALFDGTTFVTPPISVPPNATVSYQVDYALWFPVNGKSIPTFYNHADAFFFKIYRDTLTSCNASLAENKEPPVPFRRVYASEVWAKANPGSIDDRTDRIVGFQQAIVDKFKPVYAEDYAQNTAMGLVDVADSAPWQNITGDFACSRMRMIFPHRLDVAVYKVTITIRN